MGKKTLLYSTGGSAGGTEKIESHLCMRVVCLFGCRVLERDGVCSRRRFGKHWLSRWRQNCPLRAPRVDFTSFVATVKRSTASACAILVTSLRGPGSGAPVVGRSRRAATVDLCATNAFRMGRFGRGVPVVGWTVRAGSAVAIGCATRADGGASWRTGPFTSNGSARVPSTRHCASFIPHGLLPASICGCFRAGRACTLLRACYAGRSLAFSLGSSPALGTLGGAATQASTRT